MKYKNGVSLATLFAHEDHRDLRPQQMQRGGGLERARVERARLVRRSPNARLPIWSWFCRNEMKALGGKSRLGLAALFAVAMPRGLALIDEPFC